MTTILDENGHTLSMKYLSVFISYCPFLINKNFSYLMRETHSYVNINTMTALTPSFYIDKVENIEKRENTILTGN